MNFRKLKYDHLWIQNYKSWNQEGKYMKDLNSQSRLDVKVALKSQNLL